ncbi:neuropeptides capa receptor [Biomphalaria glabrata]|uniref:G-protein coupled receptors family 1 profile domain-containing protein n=1 Tax=Biomphalaria glabrata TaxID=6526 RepID=A0A2C9LSJ7_BIOGL|nr:neuropeptides capa receptor [Biomphalaria glabrata]
MASVNVTRTVVVLNTGAYNPIILDIFLVLNGLIISELIGILGIFGNIVNVLNFRRQGLHDSVTITLTALSVSDCGALVCQQVMTLLSVPWVPKIGLPLITSSTVMQLQGYFIRVSGVVTAFASFERCLCVVMPLKVRAIITVRVSMCVNVTIFLVLQLHTLPHLLANYVDYKFIPQLNQTILYLFYRDNGEAILQVSYYVTDLCVPYATFVVIISCTSVTVLTLKAKSNWRSSVTLKGSGAPTSASLKERKLVQMLAVVSVIFVVCLAPQSAMLTAVGVVRDLRVGGAKFDISMLCYCFTLLLETIHCSINSIVYYKMSSRYREEIWVMFPFLQKSKK